MRQGSAKPASPVFFQLLGNPYEQVQKQRAKG